MKIAGVFGLMVAVLAALGFAVASVSGDFEDKVIAVLQARDYPLAAHEIKELVKLIPRDTVTVTTTALSCAPYGLPPVASTYFSTETPVGYGTTSVEVGTATLTPVPTPETSGSTVATVSTVSTVSTTVATVNTVNTETATGTTAQTPTESSTGTATETPAETPGIPVTTPSVGTTPVISTTAVESSTVPTFKASTPVETPKSSTVVETTSTATHTTVSTTSTNASVPPISSTGVPLAPNNGGGTVGVNVGLLGLVAALALA
ncbi:hypothetical protein ABEF93_007228 [Exophiala dermatitidis]